MDPEFVIVLEESRTKACALSPEVVMDPEFVIMLEDPKATTPYP